ncbi:MAG TPA: energy transducer TonB [Bryobacteraceae bacterium]|nr:energy transducer TonB [Bryobacteraceae bacterium]
MNASKLICAAAVFCLAVAAADLKIVRMASVPEGKIAQKVAPVYPPDAIDHHIQGVVKIKVLIAADGHVEQAHIASGHPLLAHAALQAVKQWKFQPLGSEDQPIRVATEVEVPFRLNAPGETK